MLSAVHQKLKGGPGAAPLAAEFVDDTKLGGEAVHVLEGRAALQRDQGGLEKRADRNHMRSNNSRQKVLPQDGQAAGMRARWREQSSAEQALGDQFLPPVWCHGRSLIALLCCWRNNQSGGVTSSGILCCCYSHRRWPPLGFLSTPQTRVGGGFRNSLCTANVLGTQSCPLLPEEIWGTALERGRVGCDIPARPEQSWVQEVRPVRSSNDKHLSGGVKAIKLSQEL